MSRIAEASARAGRAVSDNLRVDWATERKAAEDLLDGTAPQTTERPSRPTVASSPRAVDSSEQTFPWPPEIDLDEIDLSRDANTLNFRRPWTRTQTARDQRRLEFDDHTPGDHSQVRHESAALSQPPPVSATLIPPRVTVASRKRGAGREPARGEARRVTLRWVVIAVALLVVVASVALLMYFLRNRQVAANQHTPAPLEATPATNALPERDLARASSAPSSAEPAGTVRVPLPIRVDLYEKGQLLGTNESDGLRLRTGAHQLELVNESLRYRASKRVNISAGRTTTVPVALPVATVQLNAMPWAQVTIDGNAVGETPLALTVPIGQHQIVFRNPQLREQTRSVLVTTVSPTHVTVDLRK
jgi:PEGA domain-containing protein